MSTGSLYMRGHTVQYDHTEDPAVRYLHELDRLEIQQLFDLARRHGTVEFEDDRRRKFTLEHQGGTVYRIAPV